MQTKNFEFKTKNMFVQITSRSNFLAILLYINEKIMGARALARAAHTKSYLAVKIQKSSNFGLGGRIFHRRARGSAQISFCHRILHEISHLPDTLNVFISLELVAVDGFEVGALKCTSEYHRVK